MSAARSCASFTGGTDLPTAGAGAPAWDVEKKTGSIRSKSRSSRMRWTSTEPTIPRQPMSPTCIGESMISSHKSQVTSHKSQVTNHKPELHASSLCEVQAT